MKQRVLKWAVVSLLQVLFWQAALSCLTDDRDCSLDSHCCSGSCVKPRGSVYGKCGTGEAVQTYRIEFWPHSYYQGSGLIVTLSNDGLGACRDFSGDFAHLNDQISSLKWSDNAAIVVYDQYNCGGNNQVVYSSGIHQMTDEDMSGNTRQQGFLAGKEYNLQTVCKRNRCGSTSTSSFKSHTVGGSAGFDIKFFSASADYGYTFGGDEAIYWDRCQCEKTWNDDIRSYRVFRLNIGNSKDLRRK